MNQNVSRYGPAKILAVTGGLLTVAGIVLATVPLHHGTISQWNGLCSSDVGQIGQVLDPSAQRDCGAVSLADHLIGWLLGGGILILAGSALLWIRSGAPQFLTQAGGPGRRGPARRQPVRRSCGRPSRGPG